MCCSCRNFCRGLENGLFVVSLLKVTDFLAMPYFYENKTRLWSIAGISRLEMSNPPFPALSKFKIVYAALDLMNNFPHYNCFPTNEMSQASR